jgi:tetratricopeptide (TPR) repeat protein
VSLGVMYFWLMRQRDYRQQAVLLLAVLTAIFAFFFWRAEMPPERRERFEVAFQVEDVRFKVWQPALAIWKDHFWFGAGPAHFDYRFRQYRPADADLQSRPDRVHNDYLNTLADWGLVGAVLVSLCWIAFYYQVFSGWKYVQRSQNDLAAKRSNKAAFVAGGAMGLLAILVHSFVDFNMHIPANAILVVTLFGLVASHYRFASERYWHTVRWPLRIPILAALAAAILYLAPQAWNRTAESYWLAKSRSVDALPADQINALKKAWDVDNRNFETAYDIGEAIRLQSGQGSEGYKAQAQEALTWFAKSIGLNRYNPHPFLRSGMCLDWIDEHQQAETFFAKAEALDPNSYYIHAHVGWHYFQIEKYEQANERFERSIALLRDEKRNPIPHAYLKRTAEKLKEAASTQ